MYQGTVARAANVIMIRQMSGQLSRALLLFVTRTILQLRDPKWCQ